MNYVISNECMACGRCAANCPTSCIYPGADRYEINQDECAGCSTCISVCPIGAISEK